MTTKTFEIRDRATRIIATAIKLKANAGDRREDWLVHAVSGYSRSGDTVALMELSRCKATFDPSDWVKLGLSRTMPVAHQYIIDHFDDLIDGVVVDVEWILRETDTIKESDQFAKIGG